MLLGVIISTLLITSLIDAAPAPKPVAKPGPRPAPRPAPKPAPKPAPRPVAKPEPKPGPKPAPKPHAKAQFLELFPGSSVYPNVFYNHQPFAFNPYPNPFYTSAYVQSLFANGKKNGTDTKGKLSNGSNGAKSADSDSIAGYAAKLKPEDPLNLKAQVFTFDQLSGYNNIDAIPPPLAGKADDEKITKTECLLALAKTGNFTARLIGPLAPTAYASGAFGPGPVPGAFAPSPVSPNGLDPIFGPELAPRYEIRYTPGGGEWNFEAFPNFFGGGGPFIGGDFPLIGNFGGVGAGFPFLPPFDNKTTPANGNGGGSIDGKKGDSEPEKPGEATSSEQPQERFDDSSSTSETASTEAVSSEASSTEASSSSS